MLVANGGVKIMTSRTLRLYLTQAPGDTIIHFAVDDTGHKGLMSGGTLHH